jgi:hypothetical protein
MGRPTPKASSIKSYPSLSSTPTGKVSSTSHCARAATNTVALVSRSLGLRSTWYAAKLEKELPEVVDLVFLSGSQWERSSPRSRVMSITPRRGQSRQRLTKELTLALPVRYP